MYIYIHMIYRTGTSMAMLMLGSYMYGRYVYVRADISNMYLCGHVVLPSSLIGSIDTYSVANKIV